MLKPKPYRFVVRLPSDMKDQILDASREYRRSMNSEIVARLQQSLQGLPEIRDNGLTAPLNAQLEQVLKPQLTEDEANLLRYFRRLNPGKREALLRLLT